MTLRPAFIVDAARTPIGRYAGALAQVRADDLAAVPISAIMARLTRVDWAALDVAETALRRLEGIRQIDQPDRVARRGRRLTGLPARNARLRNAGQPPDLRLRQPGLPETLDSRNDPVHAEILCVYALSTQCLFALFADA